MNQLRVPFVDLRIQHARIADVVAQGFEEVLAETSFILGPQVDRFEREFADYCGVSDSVGVGNGTDAIELALRGVGVGPGDEVVLPANTFVATAEAVARVGADVVLCDVTDDHLIDPEQVAGLVTERTRAVIGVDLYGQVAPFERLREVVPDGVVLIEDAAQSQGATRFGARSGSVADVAATSFYPGKNLGAYGDGGAVMTDDADVAARIRQLRNHGGVARYEHNFVGLNSRLDSLQAVVLSAKLAVLDLWNKERQQAADRYADLLTGTGLELPRVAEGNEHVWHLFVVQTDDRPELQAALDRAGVANGIHYPAPVHQVPAFAHLGHVAGDFPVVDKSAARILSLPIFPGITPEQQERVAAAIKEG